MNSEIIKELEFIFRILNEERFQTQLAMPKFRVIETDKEWQWKVERVGGEGIFVIATCEKNLMKDIRIVIADMLHVMVHMYCAKEGIRDTCKNGWYHNSLFAVAARTRGLIVEQHQVYGVSTVDVQPEVYEVVMSRYKDRASLKDMVSRHRTKRKETITNKRGRENNKRYECPICGCKARASATALLICGKCNTYMELNEY